MKGYDQSEASFPKSRTSDKGDLCYSLSKGISARHAAVEESRAQPHWLEVLVLREQRSWQWHGDQSEAS